MKKSNLLLIILAVIVSSIGIFALFKPGFFLTDDGNSMVIRFSAFYEALRSGQFPVRFLPRLNYEYGYPVADFLYPLFMYIGIPIHLIGFSFLNTIKVILGLSFISGTLFSFLWLRKLFDEKSAFIGSIVYSLFPYHLYDMYKRGSVGEVLALGIIPFILWQIERRSFFWTSVGIFLLILSHNTLAVLFLIFIFLYGLLDIYVTKKRDKLAKFYTVSLAIGLGLSSFFSIPALFDLQYTVFSKTSVSDWTKYFADFNQIGLSTLIVFIAVLFFFLIGKIEIKKHRLTVLLFAIGLLSVFLSNSLSSPLWKIIPSSFIQFPFRLLSLTILSASFLSASIVSAIKSKKNSILIILILFIVIFSAKDFISPKVFQNYPDTFYSTNQDSTTVKNEYMPKWVKVLPSKMPSESVRIIKGEGEIGNLLSKGSFLSFNLNLNQESLIEVNKVYFPGWRIKVDGKETPIFYDNKYGIIQFKAQKGEHLIKISFGETNFRLVADLISIICFISLFYLSKKYDFS